ncbi:(2,3-dihydroxybenzoyl)adenylate synthase [Pelagibacterium lacus]|uniref:2,3-dihydroxybenzoate-AMP ligase n=1 Tax=Pelagibacterium lacus TaxID=2282655 RepID=A0A369VZK2_9HYPH|nr:AMP-binding protein [Pelagibacterium lacus]RDE07844.1 2,3-dihydroxybenzoate-AMP ligase [Pelagibacterium lacus]
MKPLEQIWPDNLAARYRTAGYWTGETFSHMLRERAARWPDRVAVVGGEERWTYGDLLARAERIAAGLLALGLRPGDRVVVQLPNIPEFFAVIFGLFRARLIPVYALPAHRLTEITHFARKAEAAAYVCAESFGGFDYRGLARELCAALPAIRHVVVVGDAAEFTPLAGLPADAGRLPPDAAPSDVAFLQISGGSTGLSKLIPRTHDDYLYSVRESARICRLDENSVYLAALPVAHNFPMSSPGVLGALWAGSRIVLAPAPGPEVAFPLIAREKVTITGLVPPLALLWMQAAKSRPEDISSLEILQVGGAKFMPEAARRVRAELGCQLQQVFGMAEGLVNYTRLDDPDSLVVETQGRPISPDDEIRIVDEADNPVPEGEPGHLLTRGPYTIRAYHNDDQANLRAFTTDGFYRTGDVVKRTPEGYLVVQGRATDHINRAGEKISAEEIEDHLLAHPDVFDAVVVSIPDPALGERSCAFVIAHAGAEPRPATLKGWMRQRDVAAFKVPDQIVLVPGFETTAVGKISRKQLRARLRETFLAEQETA